MLYLKSLTMHRFKSFKHAELLFSKGFTCVVGPNGSGKSNICDAMLFGLGESSLMRLRAKSLDSLITLAGPKAGVRKGYVTMELDGEEQIKITRGIRSDGKSIYLLNGKKHTRSEVRDLLAKHGLQANETSTITQGEINRINEMGAKDRRELIDIASGIEEFERKKDESIRELSKVGQRISESQLVLEERTSFLKELESEKEAAEKYLQLGSRLKSLNYSILFSKKKESESAVSEYDKSISQFDSSRAELKAKIEGITKNSQGLETERQKLTRELGESAKAMGAINARLEALKMEAAKLEMESANISNSAAEGEKSIASYEAEISESESAISKNAEDIAVLEGTIKEHEAKLAKTKTIQDKSPSGFADIEGMKSEIAKKERELEHQNTSMFSLKGEASRISAEKESLAKELKNLSESLSGITSKISSLQQRLKEENSKHSSAYSKTREIDAETDSLNKRISNCEENIIELRLKKGSMQQRGSSSYERISSRFSSEKGFYGRVSDLCSYDDKHSVAIETAAGPRLEYIIVDSMRTADLIIKYLRENGLGRATFIPLEELMPVKEIRQTQSILPLLSLVKFDAKFRNALAFVFSNTLLVGNSGEAKKLGIGNYRYVTAEGDLIEQSGIVSGGSGQRRISAAGIEKQIKTLTEESISLKKLLNEKTTALFNLRKEAAYSEAGAKSIEKELDSFSIEAKKLESSKSGIEKSFRDMQYGAEKVQKELATTEERHRKLFSELESSRMQLSETYNRNVELSKQLAKHGMSEADLLEMEELRKNLENLKIRKAELHKENQMLEKKSSEAKSKITLLKKSISESRKRMAELERLLKETKALRSETELKITSDNDTSRKIYGKINAVDSEIAKMASEISRLSSEYSITDRQFAETKFKKEQIETRIADITAELSAYPEKIEPLEENAQEMEKEVIVINSRLSELGNVNLKAPEMFLEKKKSVGEALGKVETLENERHAVLRMIEEIDSKKLQTFMATLNDVAKNFAKMYCIIFPGSASIRLENPKDPFNSGLVISVLDNGKSKVIDSMSGGEKSLLSLILIFSIHLCKPSGLYIFDEVDSALDKENSRKLSQLIKEMSGNAQFVVVSHNDSLIVNADTAIGVVKTEDESKAVGIEVSSIINRKK